MPDFIKTSSLDRFTLISLRVSMNLEKFKIDGYRFIVSKNDSKNLFIPSGRYNTVNFYLIDASNTQGNALMFYFDSQIKMKVVTKYRFKKSQLLEFDYISFLQIPEYFKPIYRNQIDLERSFNSLKSKVQLFFN